MMKKTLALILAALMALTALSFVACGSINKTEVSVIWAGEADIKVPDSLINCMDRAMYIQNIHYKNYGAEGSGEKQYDLAKAAVDGGCAVLVVEVINPLEVGRYIELAKGKSIPVIFIGNQLVSSAVALYEATAGAYDKCVIVRSNSDTAYTVQAKQIADYVKENFDAVDRNGDRKITYMTYLSKNETAKVAAKVNELLATEEYAIKVGGMFSKETVNTELVFYPDAPVTIPSMNYYPALGAASAQDAIMKKNQDAIELIITDDDTVARDVLVTLQKHGFNKDELVTKCIALFTVGFEADYKAYVLENKPKDESKVQEYLENSKHLCDLTVVEEEDLAVMIWNTKNVIGTGRIAGTVIEDQDAITGAVASIVRNFIKGKTAFDGLDSELVKDGKEYLVPYIAN